MDVSIPGNSELPVEIRRRRNPSQSYNNEFADWQLVAPTVSTKIMEYEFNNGNRWGKKRCSDPLIASIPISLGAKAYLNNEAQGSPPQQYSDGVLLDVPGRASGQLLDKTVTAAWPAAAKKVTASGWYFTCILNIDGNGTEGFYGYAPNGERYRFDIKRSRNAITKTDAWYITHDSLGANVTYSNEPVYYDVLAASEVTDVNGNWVRYVYDSEKMLTRVHSNDGRQIDLTYTTTTPYRITTVVAHPGTADERRWTYEYGDQTFPRYKEPSQANGIPTTITGFIFALRKVNLPNGRSWQFALGGLAADAVPGDKYRAFPVDNSWVTCKQVDQVVSITHPDGIVGQFELKEFKRFNPIAAQAQYGPPCPKSTIGRDVNTNSDFMAVTKKTLSAPGVPTAIWQYNYLNVGDQYAGQVGSQRSAVTWPDGSVHVNHYYPTSSSSVNSIYKEQIYFDSLATTPLQTTDYVYLYDGQAGSGFVRARTADVSSTLLQQEVTLTRGSDWYKTRNTYVTNRTAANYSYGFPTQIDQWSSLGSGTRTSVFTYLKDEDDWILGLLDTVTKNGTLFDDYDYDTKGRLTTHKRFGVTVASLGYYTSGVEAGKLNWYQDALNRQTTFADYYRSAPRTITRADNTMVTRAIDSNGWVTRHTNARGYATFYSHDPMGRLTQIDRPSPWTDTSVSYVYSGSSLVQTATRGTERTTTTHDAMLRPTRVQREDLSLVGGSIYTETGYDAMGRAIFTSLPAASTGSVIGTATSYDMLGRVTQTRETAAGGGTTSYAYLTGNKTRVTDPLGNVTTTTASGFGSPEDGKTVKTEKPQGITVDMSYDIYGNLLSIAQAKGDGTTHTSSFIYDARQRLCRRKIPERGDDLYLYNDADEKTAYAEGQVSGTSCAIPPAASSVAMNYDLLGRLLTTDYPGTTPDIVRSYDANGNLLTAQRGGINWSYAYNSIDLIEDETLNLDGRTYGIDNGYDTDGALTSKTYPGGQQYIYTNDGLNRPTRIQASGTSYVQNISYHPNGKIHFLTRGNGGLYEQRLNERQLPSFIGGTWGDSLNYIYDANGRVTQIDANTYNAYDRSFGYDGAGRLSSATGPWGAASFNYDALGNIKQQALGSRVVDIEYNSLNQVLRARDSAAGSTWRSYAHDARGNVANDGLHGFSYDFSNQPVTLTGADSGSYSYDGNLKRVKQAIGGETIYSIYDKSGALVMRDNATTGVKTDYLSVGGQTFVRIKNGVAYYPLNDHLGTALMEADSNGNIAATSAYNYAPFGENIAPPFGSPANDPGNTNEQGYAGHIQDATGLTYMQARYYDPVIGRFLSPDPVGYEDQLNIYAYVYNDPINKYDLNGMWAQVAIGAGVGALFGGFSYALSATPNSFNFKDMGINMLAGGAVGAITAAVPAGIAAGTLNFGSKVANVAASLGGAAAAGAVGSVATQATTGDGTVDYGEAAVAGAANATGVAAGAAFSKPAQALSTTVIPANPGLPVTSLSGKTFMVGATEATTHTDAVGQQMLQDSVGEISSALTQEAAKNECNSPGGCE